ncbi:hypothetical protein MRX96_056856 [Rhipicephalus microplus]
MYGDIHKLSNREKLIIDQCIMKANMKSTKAARYKKEWLYDSLLLKIKSTAVYTFLHENNFLPPPHPRTLYSYLKNLKAGFGFDENLFAILKDKVGNIPERERRGGVLMFDEMSAVGAFCTSVAAPGSAIAKLLLHCIVLLSNAGVIVDAVTCDNSTSNRSALNSLGISGDIARVSTSFEHPCDSSEVVQVIIDPPHIFKCIRNNLRKAGKFLLPGDKEVQHFYFEALLDYEEQQAGRGLCQSLRKHTSGPTLSKNCV